MAHAPYAMDVKGSRGRRYPEPQHRYRNDYARDRDRVIHSRAFRRLAAKTQVFTTRYSDHFRNRLTHTLEVTQIARTAADALRLNTDLAEALALVHDIGHPPFGHAGERQLDIRMREYGDYFDHNLHALHIVEKFEQRYLDFPGLNLTFEVREGIIKHSRDYSAADFPALAEYLLDIEQLCAEVPLFARAHAEVDRRYPVGERKLKFNEALKRILDYLVTDLILNTRKRVAESGAGSVDDIRSAQHRLASFSPDAARENADLKRFLHSHVYSQPAIDEERNRSAAALDALFDFFMQHPNQMSKHHAELAEIEPRHRVVCDYIAGMTDHFLLRQWRELVGTATVPSDLWRSIGQLPTT